MSENTEFGHILFGGHIGSAKFQKLSESSKTSTTFNQVQPSSSTSHTTSSSLQHQTPSLVTVTSDSVSSHTTGESQTGTEGEEEDDEYVHHQEMEKCARELQSLFESNISEVNISQSVTNFDDAMSNPENPLLQGLPLKSKNIFVDIIRFALEHNKDLLYTILD